ncbi:MAG TPA: hypothetical protein VHW72_18400 [Candidatus Angelobacter sp.]|jgi:hypothetical protein|nr:hypothetical protein [Candidatus Angelobacter sp.]
MEDSVHRGRIPIEKLKDLPEHALLPENQQRFLEAYLDNNYDAKAAVKAAYPLAKKPESIRVMASRLLNSPGIVMLLHLHYGDDPKLSFCQMLAKMILRGRISKEQAEMMKLLADVHEFRQPWTPRYEKQIVEQLNRDGMANNRQAVKRRVQRAAKTAAVKKAAEDLPAENLLGEFKNL